MLDGVGGGTVEWRAESRFDIRPPRPGDYFNTPFDLSDYVDGLTGQAKWVSDDTRYGEAGSFGPVWTGEFVLVDGV